MSRRFATRAEYWRHHRRCFALALELGVTPREAELELERREVRARCEATHARYLAATHPKRRDEPPIGKPWMMQD